MPQEPVTDDQPAPPDATRTTSSTPEVARALLERAIDVAQAALMPDPEPGEGEALAAEDHEFRERAEKLKKRMIEGARQVAGEMEESGAHALNPHPPASAISH